MDKNIQYILEVARCGGITRAAEKLYITPSALSKFVQAREEEMNIRIISQTWQKVRAYRCRTILCPKM